MHACCCVVRTAFPACSPCGAFSKSLRVCAGRSAYTGLNCTVALGPSPQLGPLTDAFAPAVVPCAARCLSVFVSVCLPARLSVSLLAWLPAWSGG